MIRIWRLILKKTTKVIGRAKRRQHRKPSVTVGILYPQVPHLQIQPTSGETHLKKKNKYLH